MRKGCGESTQSLSIEVASPFLLRLLRPRGLAGQLVGMRLVVGFPSGVHGLGSRGAQFLGREGGCAGLTTETRQIRDVNDDPLCHCLKYAPFYVRLQVFT
jgi:hypothetical protein